MSKRLPREVPGWDEFYMGLAFLEASRSKDPDTQIGAVIIDTSNRPLGFGCNGAPRQIKDCDVDWSRPAKYHLVRHAEENAIDHCRAVDLDSLKDCAIYITSPPCAKCTLHLVSKGIKRIVYGPQKWGSQTDKDWNDALEIVSLAGARMEGFSSNLTWIEGKVKWLKENVPQLFQR